MLTNLESDAASTNSLRIGGVCIRKLVGPLGDFPQLPLLRDDLAKRPPESHKFSIGCGSSNGREGRGSDPSCCHPPKQATARCGMRLSSLGHWVTPLLWVRPVEVLAHFNRSLGSYRKERRSSTCLT